MLRRVSRLEVHRGTPKNLRTLVLGLTLLAIVFGGVTPAYADAWAGTRQCASNYSCRVISNASGNVTHKRCNVDYSGCVNKGSWANGPSADTRQTWHGTGLQGVMVTSTGTLNSQSAVCICLTGCPE